MTNNIIEPLLNNFPYEDNDYYISLDDGMELNAIKKIKKTKKTCRKIFKKKLILKFDFLDKGKKVTKIVL